jgi:DNA-binding NarL/FixJ family response regulator
MRVVIADDAVLFREGVANLLRESGLDVVGQAGDAVELMGQVRDTQPDVVIVDIRMPPTHTLEGLEAAKSIRAEHPDVGVLVLSQYVEAHYALRLLEEATQGAGYLLLVRSRSHDPLDALTDRERQVLSLMAEGRSNHAIAKTIYVTDKTVEAHVRSIFTKLDLQLAADDHRRVLAVVTYLSQDR